MEDARIQISDVKEFLKIFAWPANVAKPSKIYRSSVFKSFGDLLHAQGFLLPSERMKYYRKDYRFELTSKGSTLNAMFEQGEIYSSIEKRYWGGIVPLDIEDIYESFLREFHSSPEGKRLKEEDDKYLEELLGNDVSIENLFGNKEVDTPKKIQDLEETNNEAVEPDSYEHEIQSIDEPLLTDLDEIEETEEGFLNELEEHPPQQEFDEPLEEVQPDLPPETINNPLQLAHLNSDSAHNGKDLLGFEQDVEAFAAIMALKELTPPLAIALFGQWGTGKSFFMQKLLEKVEELAEHQGFLREDEGDDKGQEEDDRRPFCEGVCQIQFNAWSYMDTNLWASLVTRIFEGLDDYINDKHSAAEEEKDAIKTGIAEQLDVAKGQIAELESRKAQVQNAIDTLRKQASTAKSELEGTIDDIRKESRQIAINKAIKDSGIEGNLKEVLDNAGINQEKLDQINPDLILKELKSAQTFVHQFLKFSLVDWLLVVVGVLLFVVPQFIPSELKEDIFLGLENIGAVLTLLVGGLAKVRNTTKKLSPLVNGVLSVKNDYDEIVKIAISQHEQEILAKQIEADQKEVELNQLNGQLKMKEAEINELHYKPKSVLAQKAMYNFITRKAASSDYSKHLGIISMIRKDFQTLSELFVESRMDNAQVPEKDKERYKKFEGIRDQFDKPLERIILYVDDLDRCPEDRVIEVLEAVNLLMAFPLFVVVVGVDPRWVKNALIKKYHLQFTGRMSSSDKEIDSLGMEVINPSDYLEKIFQIPFHLKAPEDESIKNMITHLLGDAVEEKRELPAGEETIDLDGLPDIDLDMFFEDKSKAALEEVSDEMGEEEEPRFLSFDGDLDIPAMAPAEAENEEQEDTQEAAESELPPGLKKVTPASLKLHWEEGEYMRNLSWLIGNTPRTVKRFVNMYRIIRAHEGLSYENDENKKDLLGIMFLLALQTGSYSEYEMEIKMLLPKHHMDDHNFGFFLEMEITGAPGFADAQNKFLNMGYMNFLRRLSQSEDLKLVREMNAHDLYCLSLFVERFRFNTLKIKSYPDFNDKGAFDPPEPPDDLLHNEE